MRVPPISPHFPHSRFPIPDSRFPTPDSRFPIPVPLLGGVRGGFRFPIPYLTILKVYIYCFCNFSNSISLIDNRVSASIR
ncbi:MULTISPECIES: hypothetical protein [Moorena]|uniref:hypothetical protein n=1 Tax=Moorena TaxID=1155738 RepID=UPI0002F16004|nr:MULTISPECIES: hypothetical protein [Moorena]NEP66978.1 hypothetical protein [Moorena sp. SIO3A5]NER88599.1 hypothetical protein [Moorena sp. SIO3A2]